jgi:hypothetical protein
VIFNAFAPTAEVLGEDAWGSSIAQPARND